MKCVTLVYNYVIWTHNYVFAFDWEHYPSDRGGGGPSAGPVPCSMRIECNPQSSFSYLNCLLASLAQHGPKYLSLVSKYLAILR